MNNTTRVAIIVLAVAAVPAHADPPVYHLELLGPASDVEDINELGQIVGGFSDAMSPDMRGYVAGPTQAYELLPLPDGYVRSWANSINDAGVIVGGVSILGYPNEHGDGCVWTPNGQGGYDVEVLGRLPGHTDSVATAINNRGDIIGTSIWNDSGFGPAVWFNAPGGILNLQALGAPNMPQEINDNGLVVGFAASPFDIDTLQPVPFPPGMLGGTALLAVNNNDEYAGYVVASCQCSRFAVRYTHKLGWEQIGGTVDPSAQVSAFGMNDFGDTVGDMTGPAAHYTPHGTIALENLLAPEFANWSFCSCYGEAINNAGQIAAMAYNGSSFEFGVAILTPIGSTIIPGDVNGDAVVDLDDHCAWQQNPIDLDGDGDADDADEQWLIERLAELGFIVADCNGNGAGDHCDIAGGASQDCDENGVPDDCQPDCNGDGIPDVCEPDCNGNGIADPCDLDQGTSLDCNENGVPDECDEGGVSEAMNVFDPSIELIENDVYSDDLLVTDVGVIEDLDFTIDIGYRIGYLSVELSHGGTTITLIDKPGDPQYYGGFAQLGYDIVLDDEGTGGPIEDEGGFGYFEPITSPPSYTPNEALSAFDGMPMEGVWTVHIITAPQGSPTGSFNDWGLTVTRAEVPVGPCTGDVNGDGVVDFSDLLVLLASWGPCSQCPADFDGNGAVDFADLLALLANWS